MAGKAGVLREKNTTSCYLFLFYFIIHFLLLDNSIAYMFIHTAHACAHGTVKGNTPPPPAIPHRVGGDHEFSGTQDSDTGQRSAVDNVSD